VVLIVARDRHRKRLDSSVAWDLGLPVNAGADQRLGMGSGTGGGELEWLERRPRVQRQDMRRAGVAVGVTVLSPSVRALPPQTYPCRALALQTSQAQAALSVLASARARSAG
jgi:hypothetical protein